MSNPTSNFGWQMPTSTDLVTNLPADFEVFGQAVDSDFADLLGGTTGQVLKKNTNADLDFVWAADSAGMTNPMTTTGDTIYSSPNSTPVRLGIGTNGQVLTVQSGVPSWASPASSGMTLINTGGTALTGASTVTISSIPGTYKNLYIYIEAAYVSNINDNGKIGFNGDTGNNYAFTGLRMQNGGTPNTEGNQLAGIYFAGLMGTSDTGNFTYMEIPNYAKTNHRKVAIGQSYFNQGTYWYSMQVNGIWNSNSAITSINVITTATSWSGGTIYVYGGN